VEARELVLRDGVVRHRQRQSRGRHGVGRLIDVGETLDLETLGNLEEGGEVLLVNRHFSTVHELEESLHLVVADVLEEDYRVFVRGVVEHALEVGRTGGQDHLVGFQVEAITGNGHIHKGFMVEEVLEDRQEVVLVVVPAQAVLLRLGGGDGHGG